MIPRPWPISVEGPSTNEVCARTCINKGQLPYVISVVGSSVGAESTSTWLWGLTGEYRITYFLQDHNFVSQIIHILTRFILVGTMNSLTMTPLTRKGIHRNTKILNIRKDSRYHILRPSSQDVQLKNQTDSKHLFHNRSVQRNQFDVMQHTNNSNKTFVNKYNLLQLNRHYKYCLKVFGNIFILILIVFIVLRIYFWLF